MKNNNITAPVFDAYQMATDRICALIEQGVNPWARPWTSVNNFAWSRLNGQPYSLINQMLLADPEKKYTSLGELLADISGEWLTFKQAKEAGGSVRKGEKGRKVLFFKVQEKRTGEYDDDGNEIIKHYPVARCYTIFKVSQCDGIEQKRHTDDEKLFDFAADTTADSVLMDYISREGIKLEHVKGNRACYTPATDSITLPIREQFADPAEYYSTAFHEAAHSTGHKSRLDRLADDFTFGDDTYSTEELVAEITTASILATLGIETSATLNNSAAYVEHWLRALRNDKKMVVVAAARAEKAIRRILNITDEAKPIRQAA